MGQTFTLPELKCGNYHVAKWGTYEVGSTYTIIGNRELNATWNGNDYAIVYNNLAFMGQTAEVIWDNSIVKEAPKNYEYGVGLDLTRASGYWQVADVYASQLVFLGWYTDKTFSTEVTSISTTQTGTVNVYAKWRYDLSHASRSGTYTIDNSDPLNQSYRDQRYLGLSENNLWQELKNLGITHLTFNLKLRHWGEGTAYIYVYSENNTQLWSNTFTPGASSGSPGVYSTQVTLSLDTLGACTDIYIRYKASSYTYLLFWTKSHYWYNDLMYMEMSCVVNAADINDPDNEFSWSYMDPFV